MEVAAIAEVVRLDDGRWHVLPRAHVGKSTQKNDLVEFECRDARVWVRRKASWVVGRLEVDGYLIEVPSPVPPGVLIPLMLYAEGVEVSTLASLPLSALQGRGVAFQLQLAQVFIREVIARLGGDGVRKYAEFSERTQMLRGRPLWESTFGKHPSSGVKCRTHQLVTDHALNQLILAGLKLSMRILKDEPGSRGEAARMVARWEILASPCTPSSEIFETAFRNLNRLTERYRVPLQLARILLLRLQLDPFHSGVSFAPSVVLNLASMLERVLARLIIDGVYKVPGADVEVQDVDDTSFVDGYGAAYRSVRPDLIVRLNKIPVAIIDAKFKARYVESESIDKLAGENRVSTADLFQLAFYQTRTQHRYGLTKPPVAVIVAPYLGARLVPHQLLRTIRWLGYDDVLGTKVIPLPLVDLVNAMTDGRPSSEIISSASELYELIFSALNGL